MRVNAAVIALLARLIAKAAAAASRRTVMTEIGKIGPRHLDRQAVVYVRQSTASQVEHHRNPPPANTPSPSGRIALAGRRHASWSSMKILVSRVPVPATAAALRA